MNDEDKAIQNDVADAFLGKKKKKKEKIEEILDKSEDVEGSTEKLKNAVSFEGAAEDVDPALMFADLKKKKKKKVDFIPDEESALNSEVAMALMQF